MGALRQFFCGHAVTMEVKDDWGTAEKCDDCGKAWVTWYTPSSNPPLSRPPPRWTGRAKL